MSSGNTSMSSSSISSMDEVMFGLGYSSDSELGMDQQEVEEDAIVEEFAIEIQQVQQRHIQHRGEMMARHVAASQPQRTRVIIERDREAGYQRLLNDYFRPNCTFGSKFFRNRFRMRKSLFLRIVNGVKAQNSYFIQKPDAAGRPGFHPLHKCTAAMRVLAYGTAYDTQDEYLRMAASTVKQCLYYFVESIIEAFGETYLRKPTPADLDILKDVAAHRGFPGMLGSVDCMHWEWKNCPAAWKGQFAGRGGKATIILEAVAGYNTWIWHAFFGTPGSCNDINVLDRSPLFDRFMEGKAPRFDYVVNGREYHMGYYLTDGIYPEWAAFMPAVPLPVGDKAQFYTRVQESLRKDVERAFGVLQGRFHIIHGPSYMINIEFVKRTMLACIILHNMIIEDEAEQFGHDFDHTKHVREQAEPEWNPELIPRVSIDAYLNNRSKVRNPRKHQQLKADLVEHVYKHHHP